jgi:formylglycine-generating enzyme required for sulfatase activity
VGGDGGDRERAHRLAGAPRWVAGALVVAAVFGSVVAGWALRGRGDGARCGPGFVAHGPRCDVDRSGPCPAPLAPSPLGCDAPDVRVLVPAATVVVGPSDWEAEGLVAARTIHADAFRMDAFEVTRGHWGSAGGGGNTGDAARAASGMTEDEAAAFCARRAPGGRLPTADEWIVAAVSSPTPRPPTRYPWGETGAVCRRAAWGLASGPCASGADGPDTVGSHPDGDSPLGIHDLAGNVAEWVVDPARAGAAGAARAVGGSFATDLAADLRVWARLDLAPGARDARVGFRCVYPP